MAWRRESGSGIDRNEVGRLNMMHCVRHNKEGRSLLEDYGEKIFEVREIAKGIKRFEIRTERKERKKVFYCIEREGKAGFESWVYIFNFTDEEAVEKIKKIDEIRRLYEIIKRRRKNENKKYA